MVEVIVGVTLTAVLGGLLVPLVKGFLDRRSERYRSSAAQQELAQAQQKVVDYLDAEIDRLRVCAKAEDWKKLYESLMTQTRPAIDALLVRVTGQLKIGHIRAN